MKESKYPRGQKECRVCTVSTDGCIEGRGPDDADIVFVGTAPIVGSEGEASPFIESDSDGFDMILRAIAHTKKDVWVTHVVRNAKQVLATPTIEDVENCLYWLVKEIHAVQPKVIVPFGSLATRVILSGPADLRISEFSGERCVSPISIFSGMHVLPLEHPSVLKLNSGRNVEPYTQAVKNLVKVLIDCDIIEPTRSGWEEDFKL